MSVEADLDFILERGSLEDIDELLDMAGSTDDEAELLSKLESGDTGKDDPPKEDAKPAAATPAQEQEKQDDDPEPVIRAKDGKHEIPFKVLEEKRVENATLKAQLDELARSNALLNQQLTDANIKPKVLPEHIRFSKEQLDELATYGEVGEAVAILAQQNERLLAQLQQNPVTAPAQQQDPNAPPAVIAANPDLAKWWSDPVKFGLAETIDDTLNNDPKWSNKPLHERIPEIVRRTKAALGEPTADEINRRAADALANAAPRIPNSLTDVGGEVAGAQKPLSEQLADADTQDVEAFLSRQMKAGKSIDDILAAAM